MPLAEAGWQQMACGLNRLTGNWDRVVTSPLQRCRQFADQVSRDKHLPLVQEAGIREIGFGEWEGQPVDKIWREQQALCENWARDPERHSPPGGEPYKEFRSRVLNSIDRLAHQFNGESLLLVTHGGVIKILLTIANGWPPSRMVSLMVDYGFIGSLEYERGSKKYSILYPEQNAYVYRA